MRIERRVQVSKSGEEVWRFLSDVPRVIACIPGAALGEAIGDGRYKGTFRVKLGPVVATLEGEGALENDDATWRGKVVGKGVDRRGGSRVSTTMDYGVVQDGEGCAIAIETEVTLSGPLAQVGRSGIIQDVADRLIAEFAENLEQRLREAPGHEADAIPGEFNAASALAQGIWARLTTWLRRLFGRN